MPDREKVISSIEEEIYLGEHWDEFYRMIDLQLLRDVLELLKEQEEIRHGEWKWRHGGECSECGYHNSNFNYKYCPMCGAMMDA